jgi:hypothetical protein
LRQAIVAKILAVSGIGWQLIVSAKIEAESAIGEQKISISRNDAEAPNGLERDLGFSIQFMSHIYQAEDFLLFQCQAE